MIHDGYYTIIDSTETPRTFRILTRGADAKHLAGKQVVSLGSPHRNSYTQFASIRDGKLAQWARYKDDAINVAARRLVEDDAARTQAALDYAQQTGRCFVCAKVLTDATSISQGYGPICKPFAEMILAQHEVAAHTQPSRLQQPALL